MGAADPTYPLFPIASILSAVMLLPVLLTSFVRQNWNLGVMFLCFWLFLENLIDAVNTTIWSDNAEIKYYVYCDIVSHLQLIRYVVKPMATFIITRRLYLIASLQSVELPSEAARRWNSFVEWTMGLFVPLLVAGPIFQDYVHQDVRFKAYEVFGCTNTLSTSILELLTIESWALIPPLISVFFYCPIVFRTFYRQSQDINSFLTSNASTSVSRTNYLRILALASVDIVLTLPLSIVNVVLNITKSLEQGSLRFYWSWTLLHTRWEPVSYPYAEMRSFGTIYLAQAYFVHWTSPVLAFVIFGLFGVTPEARASYWRTICTVGSWVGWKPNPRARDGRTSLGEIEFGTPPQDMSLGDVEMGLGSRRPSFVTLEALAIDQGLERTTGSTAEHNSVVSESTKEVRRTASDNGEDEHGVPVARTSAGAAIDV